MEFIHGFVDWQLPNPSQSTHRGLPGLKKICEHPTIHRDGKTSGCLPTLFWTPRRPSHRCRGSKFERLTDFVYAFYAARKCRKCRKFLQGWFRMWEAKIKKNRFECYYDNFTLCMNWQCEFQLSFKNCNVPGPRPDDLQWRQSSLQLEQWTRPASKRRSDLNDHICLQNVCQHWSIQFYDIYIYIKYKDTYTHTLYIYIYIHTHTLHTLYI